MTASSSQLWFNPPWSSSFCVQSFITLVSLLLYKSKAFPLAAKDKKMNKPVEKEKEPSFKSYLYCYGISDLIIHQTFSLARKKNKRESLNSHMTEYSSAKTEKYMSDILQFSKPHVLETFEG